MIDISLPYKNGMITYPGDTPYEEYEYKTHERDGVHIMRVLMETHSGTHFDAPYHMLKDGKRADEIPLENFMGKASVITVNNNSIGPDDIPEQLESIVLFHTKNSDIYTSEFNKDFVYLTIDGAKELVKRNIKLVGIDYLSIERFNSKDFEVHRLLMKNSIIILEGLYLANVPDGVYDFICLPLKMQFDGAPCRAVLL